ncbi:MAG: hypothetical protein ACYSUT_08475, partial [Planctomycetota bacterium]
VGSLDLIQLADQWLWSRPTGWPEPNELTLPQIREDLNADGTVNVEDFAVLSTHWQTGVD